MTEFLTEQLGGQIKLTTSLGSQSRRGITLTPQLDWARNLSGEEKDTPSVEQCWTQWSTSHTLRAPPPLIATASSSFGCLPKWSGRTTPWAYQQRSWSTQLQFSPLSCTNQRPRFCTRCFVLLHFHQHCLCPTMGIKWQDYMTNSEVLERANCFPGQTACHVWRTPACPT